MVIDFKPGLDPPASRKTLKRKVEDLKKKETFEGDQSHLIGQDQSSRETPDQSDQLHFLLVLSFLYKMPICSAFVYIFSCYVTRIPRVRSNMNPLNKHALLTVQCTVSIKSGCQGHNCGRGGRQLLPNDQLKDQGLSRRQKKLEKFYDLDLDV